MLNSNGIFQTLADVVGVPEVPQNSPPLNETQNSEADQKIILKRYHGRRYYLRHRQQILEACKRYRQTHKLEKAKRDKEYAARKKAENPVLFNKRAVERVKRYQARNREKTRERSRLHRATHAEQYRMYMEKYRPLYYAKNKTKILEGTKAYRKLHPEVQQKARIKWNESNPEKLREIRSRQAAKRRGAITSDVAVREVIRRWRKEKTFTCYYCRKTYPTKLMHVDHIIAIARGGKHESGNICKSCGPCNQSKSAKPIQNHIVNGQQFLL